MPSIKEIAKIAAVSAGMLYLYHSGALNSVPGFSGAKKAS